MNFSEAFLKELQELKESGVSHEDICEAIKDALGGSVVAQEDGDDDNGSGTGGSGPHVVG